MRKTILAVLASVAIAGLAAARDFPSRPLKIVVPNPPGGTVDLVARSVAQGLGAALGQSVVVELKPGASNIIGSDQVAKAPADGHTILLAGTHLTINPLMRKLPYDGLNAFAPVALLASTPNVIAVHAAVPVKSIAELVVLAKSKPNGLNCASSTPSSAIRFAFERFQSLAGIRLNYVPFNGGVEAARAVAAGHAEVLVAPLSDAVPHATSGKLRILAVTSLDRFDQMPDVPTLAESGFPGFQAVQWFGTVVPAGTPRPVIQRLSAEMRRALEDNGVRARFASLGITPMPLGAEDSSSSCAARHACSPR